jgi:uncharacterized membrane protein
MEERETLQKIDEFKLTEEDKVLGALCYPGIFPILIPLIIYLTQPKEKKAVRFHALHGLATHISFVGIWLFLFLLAFILFLPTLGLSHLIMIPLLFLVMFGYMGFSIYWAIRIYSGQEVKLPYITDFVLKNLPRVE